jgi:hypothetical protein
MATFGLDAGNSEYGMSNNTVFAQRFQNTVGTGTLTKLELLFTGVYDNNLRMGVYADSSGVPGSRLLDAGEVADGYPTAGWVSISGLSLAVTLNEYYWLTYALLQSETVKLQTGGPSNSEYEVDTTGDALANPMTGGGSYSTTQSVMRATVTVGGGGDISRPLTGVCG